VVLSVEVIAPEAIAPGQPLPYEIVVRNPGSTAATAVRVEQVLPEGTRLVSSEPKAQSQADRLAWSLGTVEAGGERHLKAELQPGENQDLPPPTVSFAPVAAHRTRASRPPFDVAVTGPDRAQPGEKLRFQIQIANNGGTPIEHVLVRDLLPEGLQSTLGSFVEADIGTLQAGESKTVPLEVTVAKPGTWVNEVSALADGDLKAQAKTTVTVAEPALGLRLLGPRKAAPGDIDLSLEVSNPAPTPATGVRLSQSVPNGLDVVGASGAGYFDSVDRTVAWSLGTLEAGQKQTITLRVRAKTRGDWTLAAQVVGDHIGEAKATLEMRVEVAPVLHIELAAHENTLAADAEATYEVHAANQGSAAVQNIRLAVRLPEGLTLVRADGPSAVRSAPQGVTFDPLPKLAARADAVYRIRLRGQQTGDWRWKLELSADGVPGPLREEVAVRVTAGRETPPGNVASSR
jgi:uncharacterized repeat protein (TIGR01451 family)